MLAALGCQARFVGRSSFDVLVEVEDHATLTSLQPEMSGLAAVEARGVIVTCKSASDECDFESRFFAPRFGIPEDPVTGSAHCSLGPYWAEKLNKHHLVGHQVSKRGGIVRVEVRGERTRLGGCAVTVSKGELQIIPQ